MVKPLTDRIATIKARRQQLDARLNQLEAKAKTEERKRDTRQKIIVGAAVLAHAELHPAFADQLRHILGLAVLRDTDREVIAGLLTAPAVVEEKAA